MAAALMSRKQELEEDAKTAGLVIAASRSSTKLDFRRGIQCRRRWIIANAALAVAGAETKTAADSRLCETLKSRSLIDAALRRRRGAT